MIYNIVHAMLFIAALTFAGYVLDTLRSKRTAWQKLYLVTRVTVVLVFAVLWLLIGADTLSIYLYEEPLGVLERISSLYEDWQ